MRNSPDILRQTLEAKRHELNQVILSCPLAELRHKAETMEKPIPFGSVLAKRSGAAVIAEMKRRSPSGGRLHNELNPQRQAQIYTAAGVAAVSVLTENTFFGGSLDDLRKVVEICNPNGVPVLRKDFIVEPYQIYESRAAGADAVLLIVAALELDELDRLLRLTRELGMDALVEVHSSVELETAFSLMPTATPKIVGINNRNLHTLNTSLDTFLQLSSAVPAGIIKVAESGMQTAKDAERMFAAGADAILVGESLMRAGTDIKAVLQSFINSAREVQ